MISAFTIFRKLWCVHKKNGIGAVRPFANNEEGLFFADILYGLAYTIIHNTNVFFNKINLKKTLLKQNWFYH